jgi:hypothetical protein
VKTDSDGAYEGVAAGLLRRALFLFGDSRGRETIPGV